MAGNGIRDDVAPWSFFMPVMLAVVVGVLLAGLVERGIDMVFADEGGTRDPAPVPTQAAPVGEAAAVAPPPPSAPQAPEIDPAATPGDVPPDAAAAAAGAVGTAPEATSDEAPAADAAIPALPGPIVARRDGAPEACINGTIAMRDANGWQQRLENDAPVACTEQSAAPPR